FTPLENCPPGSITLSDPQKSYPRTGVGLASCVPRDGVTRNTRRGMLMGEE
ncbi:hypothetical protein RB213_001468, partial [Colletotrichum asianum]